MPTFIKRQPRFEATRWFKNGDHPLDYANEKTGFENGELRTWTGAEVKANGWEGQVVSYYRNPHVDGESICQICKQRMHDHGWIDRGEMGDTVCPGDWVVTDELGKTIVLMDSFFQKIFEPA